MTKLLAINLYQVYKVFSIYQHVNYNNIISKKIFISFSWRLITLQYSINICDKLFYVIVQT